MMNTLKKNVRVTPFQTDKRIRKHHSLMTLRFNTA